MNAFFETMEARTLLSAVVSTTQKTNLTKLADDLSAIRADSSVTVAQIHQLDADIATAVKAATAPASSTAVSTFRKALLADLNNGPLTATETKTLAVDYEAVLASTGIPTADLQAVGTDIKSIITASHITKPQAAELWSDLEAIVLTAEANHST